MTPEERIAELEQTVSELQSEIRIMGMLEDHRARMAALTATDAPPVVVAEPEAAPEPTEDDRLTEAMRRQVDPAHYLDAEALDERLNAKLYMGSTPRPAPRPASKSGNGLEALDQHLADKFNLGPDAA